MIEAKPSVSLTLPGATTRSPVILSRAEIAARRNGEAITPAIEEKPRNTGGRPKGSKNKKG